MPKPKTVVVDSPSLYRNYLEVKIRVNFAKNRRNSPDRIERFHSLIGKLAAYAAKKCFEKGRVDSVTVEGMSTRTLRAADEMLPELTGTLAEWLGEDEDEFEFIETELGDEYLSDAEFTKKLLNGLN